MHVELLAHENQARELARKVLTKLDARLPASVEPCSDVRLGWTLRLARELAEAGTVSGYGVLSSAAELAGTTACTDWQKLTVAN